MVLLTSLGRHVFDLRVRLLVAVVVKIEPGAALLARQPTGFDNRAERARHTHALAVGVFQHFRHFVTDIEADLIDERQRSHRHAELLQQPIDPLNIDAFLEHPRGLNQVRQQNAVDQEAGAIADHHRCLAEPSDQFGGGDNRLARGSPTSNDLNQRHAIDRIEKVQSHEALRSP